MERKIFKKLLNICYEENSPYLNDELLSLEIDVKRTKNYHQGIENIYTAIDLYDNGYLNEDFKNEIENIYTDYLESLEN